MFDFLKKHYKSLTFGTALIVVIIGVVAALCGAGAGDELGFCGDVLAFIGTVVMALLALYQNQVLQDENNEQEKRMLELEKRYNQPKFIVKFKGDGGLDHEKISLRLMNVSANYGVQLRLSDIGFKKSNGDQWKHPSENIAIADIIEPAGEMSLCLDNPAIDEGEITAALFYRDTYGEEHMRTIVGYINKSGISFALMEKEQ